MYRLVSACKGKGEERGRGEGEGERGPLGRRAKGRTREEGRHWEGGEGEELKMRPRGALVRPGVQAVVWSIYEECLALCLPYRLADCMPRCLTQNSCFLSMLSVVSQHESPLPAHREVPNGAWAQVLLPGRARHAGLHGYRGRRGGVLPAVPRVQPTRTRATGAHTAATSPPLASPCLPYQCSACVRLLAAVLHPRVAVFCYARHQCKAVSIKPHSAQGASFIKPPTSNDMLSYVCACRSQYKF